MLNFTKITGLFARTTTRSASPRRSKKTHLSLEGLEGRDLMSSVVAQLPSPHAPANGALILCKKAPSAQNVGPGHNGTQIIAILVG
jgi:hypothetical protein